MTNFATHLSALGWSKAAASRILRIPEPTIRAWCLDTSNARTPHATAVLLLHAAVRFPAVRRWLERGEGE